MRCLALLVIVTATRTAEAQVPWGMPPAPEPAPAVEEPPPEPTPPAPPTPDELAARIDALEELAQKAEVVEQRVDTLKETVDTLVPLRGLFAVYVDVGFFHVTGNGSGVRSDVGHRYVSDFDQVPAEWVLLGDPLSTAVNARGEPADIGAARAIENDTINNGGNPGFLVNAVGLAISRNIGRGVSIAGLVEFLPRPGPDLVEVELAHVDYRPTTEENLVLSVGKIDSVLGVEYRAQEARRRLAVTPSLLCRYTCGRPLGVRAAWDRKRFNVSATLTNGDNFNERFEIDDQASFHRIPTVAGHVQWILPVGQGLELGVSAAVGPQDGQSATHVHQWHYGFDLKLRDLHGLDVYAEFVQGKQQGSSPGAAHAADAMMVPSPVAHCSLAQCLTYKAAYVLAGKRVKPWLTPYARVDWRDARHQRGIDFLYVTRTLRTTAGVSVEVTSKILAKVEYTANVELGTPQFPNNVLATSLVVSTN